MKVKKTTIRAGLRQRIDIFEAEINSNEPVCINDLIGLLQILRNKNCKKITFSGYLDFRSVELIYMQSESEL